MHGFLRWNGRWVRFFGSKFRNFYGFGWLGRPWRPARCWGVTKKHHFFSKLLQKCTDMVFIGHKQHSDRSCATKCSFFALFLASKRHSEASKRHYGVLKGVQKALWRRPKSVQKAFWSVHKRPRGTWKRLEDPLAFGSASGYLCACIYEQNYSQKRAFLGLGGGCCLLLLLLFCYYYGGK